MITINLIPWSNLVDRRRNRVTRRWMTACLTFGTLVGVSTMVSVGTMHAGGPPPYSAEISEIQAALASSTYTKSQLHRQLDTAAGKLTAIRLVTPQPDWSVLVHLVGAKAGERVVLNRFNLSPVHVDVPLATPVPEGESPPPPERKIAGFTIRVGGFGREQKDVFDFVLRLETTGLFDEVSLVRFRRERYLEGMATSFELECMMSTDPTTLETGSDTDG